uniref:Uncharacterized protein n=1 Tax=Aureoumbra lagunensis TaxID=44058 RepID=A0A7S3JUQ4_9STRA
MLMKLLTSVLALAFGVSAQTCNFTNIEALGLTSSYFENGCDTDTTCNSFQTELSWVATLGVDVSVETDGNYTVQFDATHTGINDQYATNTEIQMECFNLATITESSCDGCTETIAGSFEFNPRQLESLCSEALISSSTTNGADSFTIQFHTIVATGFYDTNNDFYQMVRARFCVSIVVDTSFEAVLSLSVEEVDVENAADSLELSVGIEAVETQVDTVQPCDLAAPYDSTHIFPMNERVCVHIFLEGEDAAEYFAWTEDAVIALDSSGTSYSLFNGRGFYETAAEYDYFRPGAWTPAAPETLVFGQNITDDYFTFWLPVDLLNGQELGQATITATVIFVRKDAQGRRLQGVPPFKRTVTRRLQEVLEQSNSMPAAISQSFTQLESVTGTDQCCLTVPSAKPAILELFSNVLASLLGFRQSVVEIKGSDIVIPSLNEEVAMFCKEMFMEEVSTNMIDLRVTSFGEPIVVDEVLEMFKNNATFIIRTQQDIHVSSEESKTTTFEIDSSLIYFIILIILLIVFFIVCAYRKKHRHDEEHVIKITPADDIKVFDI